MKTTVNENAPPALQTANSYSNVKPGVMYRTSRGSIVMKPDFAPYSDGYITLRDIYSRPLAVWSAADATNFPWTQVESGTSVTFTQE